LLDNFLNNYGAESSYKNHRHESKKITKINLIEMEVTEGIAEPIKLAAAFDEPLGVNYHYNVTDKARLDNEPPASIEIT
jgi:hypothetical protein